MKVSTMVPKNVQPVKLADAPTLDEQIRQRAYELYEERGRTDGCDLDDWLLAEAEVAGKRAKAARA